MTARTSHPFAAVLLASTALLGACTSSDPVYTAFNSEAGSLLDSGTFGNATMNNTQLMNGEKQHAFDLSQRFANEVLTTVNFAFNSSKLDAGARDTLREQAAWIRQFPEVRFRVYGHADAVGSSSANKALGLRRAHAVVNYLATQGIGKDRLEAVASLGGFVGGHPNVMDGKYAQIVYREYIASGVPASTLQGASTGSVGDGG